MIVVVELLELVVDVLLDVVDGASVDVEVVELVDVVDPGAAVLLVLLVLLVDVVVAGGRVVVGRRVVVVLVPYGSGHAAGAAARRARKRPGTSRFTRPPNTAHQRRVPLVSTTAIVPWDGSSSVTPIRLPRAFSPFPWRRTTVSTSAPTPETAGFRKR